MINKSGRGLLILLLFLGSCEFIDLIMLKNKDEDGQESSKPVARVYDTYLYEHDLEGLINKNISKADSSNIMERYVRNWIRQQLIIKEASKKIDFNEADLERKLLDYRYALMRHEFEKYYINQNLDKQVSEEEILDYYRTKQDNFVLKQNIIKCLFIKVPREAPRINKLKRMVNSYPGGDVEELKSYSFRFADTYSLEDSVWFNFDDVVKNTPFSGIPNKVQFLKDNNYVESSDSDYFYFLKIFDYKISDQISPIEFIRDDIENIIINKRKIALAKSLTDEIYKNAERDNQFEVF